MALVAGDSWLEKGDNLLVFGPPGGGKSHLAAAIGLGRVANGWRVLFARTTDLVQRLQVAGVSSPWIPRSPSSTSSICPAWASNRWRLHAELLDDLAYVTKDQAETSVLFELISARYERRSLLITANQPFGEWNRIFPDPAMTLAAVDRLVHPATIFELNVESYRRRAAVLRRKGPRPAANPRDTQNARRLTLASPRLNCSRSLCHCIIGNVPGAVLFGGRHEADQHGHERRTSGSFGGAIPWCNANGERPHPDGVCRDLRGSPQAR